MSALDTIKQSSIQNSQTGAVTQPTPRLGLFNRKAKLAAWQNQLNTQYIDTDLMCVPTNKLTLEDDIRTVINCYDLAYDSIFILQSKSQPMEMFITFNVVRDSYQSPSHLRVMPMQRNKATNTLYTLNALNEIIKLDNNGMLDVRHKINWNDYISSILLYNKQIGLSVVHHKIYDIHKINSYA